MDTLKDLAARLNITSKDDKGVPATLPSNEKVKELREKYKKAEQEHVFTFYDDLDVSGKAALIEQLEGIDPEYINKITGKALGPLKKGDDDKKDKDENEDTKEIDEAEEDDKKDKGPELEPLPQESTASTLDASEEQLKEWFDAGLSLIQENKVAVILMAGGQGTRLGSSAPKGCFDIGLPSGKSLFQIQAEKIRSVAKLAETRFGKHKVRKDGREEERDVVVPWYVMTSGPTRKATEEFFEQHGYFGLKRENVMIFEQGVLPCVSNEGKILLEEKGKVAVAPDGNGGIYQALLTSSVRTDMRDRGIQHIHAYCVDNCLAKVADPVFIGFAAQKDVDIATKVVRKRNAHESVGLILLKNGKPDVVEYSEIDKTTAEAKDGENLKFRAANIVNHYYSFRFFEGIELWMHKLPHHVARKKIPYVDVESGQSVKPESPNGIKLEQFVFDVFPMTKLEKFACLEVRREEEFSPLKNAKGKGEDDADTSRLDLLRQGARWLRTAGAMVVSEKPEGETGVEVSPLVSYAGEGLERFSGKEVKAPALVEDEN